MPETYETCSYSVPPSVRFKALSEKYGDTAYNRPLAPFSHTVYCNEFSGIDIFSDRDFDAAHPAGASLSDIVRIVGASPYRYIRNGYTAPFDWRDLPEDYRIENGISYLEGYLPVNGTLCELDAEEMYMLDPFEALPEIHDSPRDKKTHGYRRPAGTGNGDNGKYGNHFPIEITHPSERLWLPICRRKGKKPIFVERQSLKNTGL